MAHTTKELVDVDVHSTVRGASREIDSAPIFTSILHVSLVLTISLIRVLCSKRWSPMVQEFLLLEVDGWRLLSFSPSSEQVLWQCVIFADVSVA